MFWGFLLLGYVFREIDVRHLGVFLLLWVAGRVGLSYAAYGSALFSPYLAILDIGLVFVVFKKDVRLT